MFVLGVWIALLNLGNEPSSVEAPAIIMLLLLGILAIVFIPRSWLVDICKYIKAKKQLSVAILVLAISIGLVLRFGFLCFEYAPSLDPENFFTNASTLAERNSLATPEYIAMFPYLFAYDYILSLSFSLFGANTLAIIILNTSCDIVSTVLVGYIIHKLTYSKPLGITSSMLWWLNPFNIIFCALSLPVIIVNTLLLAIFAVLAYLFFHIHKRGFLRTVLISALLGLLMGIANCFRPIIVIIIIAICFYSIVCFLQKKDITLLRNLFIVNVIAICVFMFITGIYQQIVNVETGYPTNTEKAGWSIYVGSNYQTYGQWNQSDYGHLQNLMDSNKDISSVFFQLKNEGIERWGGFDAFESLDLAYQKMTVFSGDVQNMAYDLTSSFPFFSKHSMATMLEHVLCALYWFVLLWLSIIFLIKNQKNGTADFIALLSIVVIGLYFGFILVEAMNRYFTIFLPAFTILASLGFRQAVMTSKSEST
jgi:hypothetical protein